MYRHKNINIFTYKRDVKPTITLSVVFMECRRYQVCLCITLKTFFFFVTRLLLIFGRFRVQAVKNMEGEIFFIAFPYKLQLNVYILCEYTESKSFVAMRFKNFIKFLCWLLKYEY